MRRILALAAVVAACGDPEALEAPVATTQAALTASAETVLQPRRGFWAYWANGDDLGTGWRTVDWDSPVFGQPGDGPLGYGEPYVNPIPYGSDPNHKPTTVYFRSAFEIEDPAQVTSLRLEMMYDDGFVAYINGVEVARASMPSGSVSYGTLASGHEAENRYTSFDASAARGALVDGLNILAIEVHQQAPSSSDLVMDAALYGEINPPPANGIPRGSSWRFAVSPDLGANWRRGDYDDRGWTNGPGPLGYGESYLATTVGYGPSATAKYMTTYFRRTFTVDDPGSITRITGELMYDDGVVVYLNDHEIGRASMPTGAITATTAAFGHEAGNAYAAFDWTAHKGLLVAGLNLLAVEVHQQAPSSSDLVFDAAVLMERAPPPPDDGIPLGAAWRYWDRGGDLGTSWRGSPYDDAGWTQGPAPLGYGETFLATVVSFGPSATSKYITTYFRKAFTVDDPAAIGSITGEVMWDDGMVIYLNGQEVKRLSMPQGAVTAGTLATGHEAGSTTLQDWTFMKPYLVAGVNVMAVEVHQAAPSSSDLVFELSIRFGEADPDADADGDRLPDRVETGTGVFVSRDDTGTRADRADTDGDGLRDGDEVLGTTGGLDLPALGVSPLRKEILIEYDWVDDAEGFSCGPHSHRPEPALLTQVTQAFAAAPVGNPDGTTGIRLIHDYGQGAPFTGGNRITDADGRVDSIDSEFYAHKAANFAANRAGYFHWFLMPHHEGTGGVGELVGDDVLLWTPCANRDSFTVSQVVMHELGHNLGLHHGGLFEETNNKPNYNSVMNYRYSGGVDTNCDGVGDRVLGYSMGVNPTLDENRLDERTGICGGIPQDWNRNGVIDSAIVAWDVNFDSFLGLLGDKADWPSLQYDFDTSQGASVVTPTPTVVRCDFPPLH